MNRFRRMALIFINDERCGDGRKPYTPFGDRSPALENICESDLIPFTGDITVWCRLIKIAYVIDRRYAGIF